MQECPRNPQFGRFWEDPKSAALHSYNNSGFFEWILRHYIAALKEEDLEGFTTSYEFKEILTRIQLQMLTDEEKEELLEKFLRQIGRAVPGKKEDRNKKTVGLSPTIDVHHLICGSCGVTAVDGQSGKFVKV